MALTLISAQLVRQMTYMFERNPGVFYALKALFLHLAANKGNPDLQLVNIDGTYSSSDGGNNASQVAFNAACSLYCVYGIKRGTTDTWLKLTDNATTATTNGGADTTIHFLNGPLNTNGYQTEEMLLLWPTARQIANGITLTENTTATGSTLTLKANRVDGFIIVSQ